MLSPRVIVFLRAPELGKVKTRLAATLGAESALAIHRQLVELTLATLSPLPKVTLRVTPDVAAESASWPVQLGWTVLPQGEGDLGARLERAVAESFAVEVRPVVVVGCDCPELTAADVAGAGRLLAVHDVVFGPAADGGYWLIGLRRPVPELFRGLAWGTERVLTQSLAAAKTVGLSAGLLRELPDVDTEADWRAWQARTPKV